MRIAVCTKNDLFGAIVLNRVLPRLADHQLGIFMSVRERPETDDRVPELDLMRLLERQIPIDLVFPLLDANPPRPGCLLTPRQLATRHGCSLALVHDMLPQGGTSTLEAFRADAILSVRFSYLFRRSTIDATRVGILNVHPGPLPGCRGLYAPFWQMLRGERVLRCTVHLVDPGIDTGPVLAIVEAPVVPGRSLLWHATQLYLGGADRAVEFLLEGAPPPVSQDESQAASNHFPPPEDFARFAAAGHSLVRGADYRDLLRQFTGP